MSLMTKVIRLYPAWDGNIIIFHRFYFNIKLIFFKSIYYWFVEQIGCIARLLCYINDFCYEMIHIIFIIVLQLRVLEKWEGKPSLGQFKSEIISYIYVDRMLYH